MDSKLELIIAQPLRLTMFGTSPHRGGFPCGTMTIRTGAQLLIGRLTVQDDDIHTGSQLLIGEADRAGR